MNDLISRQQATKEMYDLCERLNCESLHIDVIVDTLENVPSAEPERKKGKWKIRSLNICHTEWKRYECSVCGWEAHLYEDDVVDMEYCPHCGVRMEEGEKE